MIRKGIILAGGTGSRLSPLTKIINKQLLPLYDKPLIFYPLSILMLAGIRDVLIITNPNEDVNFKKILGNGSNFGIKIQYLTQNKPNGLPEAFIIGENYNIGSGTVLNNIQIAKKIISAFKKITLTKNIISKINLVKDRPGHDLRYCLDSSKIKNKLKWNCKSSFDQRINETIIWYINKFRTNYFKNKDYKYRVGLKV